MDSRADVPAFYERPGLNSETYDARTASDAEQGLLSGDVDFYLSLAGRTGGPVLDVGGGTGRVALPLVRAGFDAVSLDLAPSMLAVARAKLASEGEVVASRVRFIEADMTEFDVGAGFGLAVIPFRGFQALLEPAQQRSCLASIHRHLRPGGVLAFHLFDPVLDHLGPGGPIPRADRGVVRNPASGNDVHISVVGRETDPCAR